MGKEEGVKRGTGDQGSKIETLPVMPIIQDYKDLLVWQQSMELVALIYTATQQFPKEELYGLTNQIRRAAVSVPSNIAEGHSRDYRKEYLQFLSFSLGSLAELQTQLAIAKRLAYMPEDIFNTADQLASKTFKMIKNLQRALKKNP